MQYLDLSFEDPALNLACEEALLEVSDLGHGGEILRVWESPTPFVVLGYANKVAREVRAEACASRGIPVLRRCTGGGTVIQGPGCLNYALILHCPESSPLASITSANRYLMEIHAELIRGLSGRPVEVHGVSDLAVDGRKFSGNAQRRTHSWMLFHGTFLLDFDLTLVEQLLPMPSLQPDYRQGRPHGSFLTNLALDRAQLKNALRDYWKAQSGPFELPMDTMQRLMAQKYKDEAWNFRF